MLTPLWSNRPLAAEPHRTVDVFPRLLHHLGVAIPADIDGRWRETAPVIAPETLPGPLP
jgi:hypothetical protein